MSELVSETPTTGFRLHAVSGEWARVTNRRERTTANISKHFHILEHKGTLNKPSLVIVKKLPQRSETGFGLLTVDLGSTRTGPRYGIIATHRPTAKTGKDDRDLRETPSCDG